MALREAAAVLAVALPFALPFALPAGLGLDGAADGRGPQPLLRLADPAILESSGLVAGEGLLHTANDSGDEGRVFTVDRTGRTVGVTRWAGEAVDVEALAPGPPGQVWVGDIGDNRAVRETLTVSAVPVGPGERTVRARTYRLAHPAGPADAEALLAHPRTGRLYVVTKGVLGGEVLAAPADLAADRLNRLRPVGPAMPLVTDGAFLPDGRHVVLRDYTRARVYTFPALEPVVEVPLPAQEQGEGLAVDGDRLLVSSEGVRAPVYAVDLPTVPARDRTAGRDAGQSSAEPARPTADGPQPSRPEPWRWWLGGGVLLAMVAVLLRSLRPR